MLIRSRNHRQSRKLFLFAVLVSPGWTNLVARRIEGSWNSCLEKGYGNKRVSMVLTCAYEGRWAPSREQNGFWTFTERHRPFIKNFCYDRVQPSFVLDTSSLFLSISRRRNVCSKHLRLITSCVYLGRNLVIARTCRHVNFNASWYIWRERIWIIVASWNWNEGSYERLFFFLGLVGENKRDVMEGSNVLIMICKLLNSIEILKSMEICISRQKFLTSVPISLVNVTMKNLLYLYTKEI